MTGLRLGELFAGYGGLGMAVEQVFGATTAWFSEFDDAPSRILAHHWPNVPNHGDITKINWAEVEPVDIMSGGSPCQDLSLAGKRRGMTDGTRSNLWESMREGIAVIRPRYVVWENVRGSLSAKAVSTSDMERREGFLGEREGHLRALGRVLGDLADLGFDAEWRGLRAADVGAPHGRFRVFVLASNPNNAGLQGSHNPAGVTPTRRHGHSGAGIDWGRYAGAVRKWETLHRTAPAPIERSPRGGVRLSAKFPEWMMGLPDGWVTDPAIGITRNEQLKACGNGVVPQQAMAALRDMLAAFRASAADLCYA